MVEQKQPQSGTKVPPAGNVPLPATPNTVPKVPTDWAALGATTGYCPKLAEDLNIDVVGPSGEGKTTFISSIPNQIILDFDKGAEGIPGTKAVRIPILNYEHYIQVTDKLIAEGKANKRAFHRVSFDTTDEWVGMIINRLQEEKGVNDITEHGSQGHGWAMIRERCFSKLRELQEAGYIWSCLGHMITKTETNPVTHKERTVIRDAVFPSMSAKIVRSSDYKITIYCKNKTVEKKEKRKTAGGQIIEVPVGSEVISTYYADIFTTVEREGKGRGAPGMEKKFEIPLVNGWDVFKQKYNVAVEAAKKQYG
ncbi:MAG: AAA family ATPase [Candidatus Peribacteraceae bacterium]|nr:AAA family ATPase [Candidatus Peribacteraceae bacterium]